MFPFRAIPPQLSRSLFKALCESLPDPSDPTPDAIKARDTMAIAAVAALDPMGVGEAMLAIQVVTTEAHARACLRQANTYRDEVTIALRCQALAAAMMRQMHQAMRALERLQSMRPIEAPAEDDSPLPELPRPREPERRDAAPPRPQGRITGPWPEYVWSWDEEPADATPDPRADPASRTARAHTPR